jgi:hypothetical protein
VGFLAQLLLGRGQEALYRPGHPPGLPVRLQTALWNAGVIAVPAGVLAEIRLPVVIGGATLLAALALYCRSARLAPPGYRQGVLLTHSAVIAFMAASTLVGVFLGWDRPWL